MITQAQRRIIMKTIKFIAGLAFAAATSLALALDIQPYTAETLAAKQQAGAAVALHFHADWCPTCRAQEKVGYVLIAC